MSFLTFLVAIAVTAMVILTLSGEIKNTTLGVAAIAIGSIIGAVCYEQATSK